MKNLNLHFNRIHSQLESYANRQVKNNINSHDLINDLYLFLVDNPDKVKPEDILNFGRSFIYHQIRYSQKDGRHKYSTNFFVDIDLFYNNDNFVIPEEEDELSEMELDRLNTIKKAVENMDSEMRKMYHYYYECNYTINNEIALILGKSVAYTHVRVKRMREFIFTYINNTYQIKIPCQTTK